MAGLLIMAAGSLGHSADIPNRSLEALKTADLLIFEEDRVARQWLKAASIHRSYLRYSEHKESSTIESVTKALQESKTIVYMSDQGTPGLADPGADLVSIAYKLGSRVTTIPGPSSITAAIAACPFDCNRFFVAGFPPREPGARQAFLESTVGDSQFPVILMDTPYRLSALIGACLATLGGQRKALLSIDISGSKEAFHFGTFAQLQEFVPQDEKLNFVLVIEGAKRPASRNLAADLQYKQQKDRRKKK